MKMALLLAGQARHIDKLPYTRHSILPFIDKHNPDIYCSFWQEPEAMKALDLFAPVRYNLSTEAEFQQDKLEWWEKWSAIIKPFDSVEHRRKWYWGEEPTLKSRDNTIRHWSRLTAGIHLIKEGYDVVVVTRTDVYLKHEPTIGTVEPNKMYAPCRTDGTRIDQFFWGAPSTIFHLLNWTRMIKAMAHAELHGKYGRRPMALVRGTKWLAPENTLIVTMQREGIEHVKQPFRTGVIR